LLTALVDVFSVADLYDRHDKQVIFYFIDDAVDTLSNPVAFLS